MAIRDFLTLPGFLTLAAGVLLVLSGVLSAVSTGSIYYTMEVTHNTLKSGTHLYLRQFCNWDQLSQELVCQPYDVAAACGASLPDGDTKAQAEASDYCLFVRHCATNTNLLAAATALFFAAAAAGLVSVLVLAPLRYASVGVGLLAAVLSVAGLAVYKDKEDAFLHFVAVLVPDPVPDGWSLVNGVGPGYSCQLAAIVLGLLGAALMLVPKFVRSARDRFQHL